jgi:hypothetical protein
MYAFNTALAEAGVNVQHAMHLASHCDPRVRTLRDAHEGHARDPAEILNHSSGRSRT